jgi:hypothetical protein
MKAVEFLYFIGYPMYDDGEAYVKAALFSVAELSCFDANIRAQAREILAEMTGVAVPETGAETAQETAAEPAQETVAEPRAMR